VLFPREPEAAANQQVVYCTFSNVDLKQILVNDSKVVGRMARKAYMFSILRVQDSSGGSGIKGRYRSIGLVNAVLHESPAQHKSYTELHNENVASEQ